MTNGAAGVGVGKLTRKCRVERVLRSSRWVSMRWAGVLPQRAGLRVAAIRYYQRFRRAGKARPLGLGRNMAVSGLELASALCLFGLCGSFMWPGIESGTSRQRLWVNGEYQWLGNNE